MQEKPKNKAKRKPKYDKPRLNTYPLIQIGIALFVICICALVGPVAKSTFYNVILNLTSEDFTMSLVPDTSAESDSQYAPCGIITISDIQHQDEGTFAVISATDGTLNTLNFDYLELNGYAFTDVVDIQAARQNGNDDSYRFRYQLPYEEEQFLVLTIHDNFSENTDETLNIVFEKHYDVDEQFRPELLLCGE